MKVLRVEQYKAPFVKEIDPGLESLQHEVEGTVQAVYPFDDPVALLCNDDGKLLGLELNRALRDDNGEIYDVIAGSFLIVGCGEEDFDSLSEDMIGKYREIFSQPEVFIRTNSGLLVLPYVTEDFTYRGDSELDR